MKKVIVILAFALMATAAYAVTPDPAALKGFNATKNVSLNYVLNASGTSANAYGVVSQHTQGDKAFASTSAYGGIVSMTTTPGTICSDPPTTPATPTDSTIAASWTKM
jgi:hypothetical protein